MKYCAKCGAEMLDEAVICVKCGSFVNCEEPLNSASALPQQESNAAVAAKIFMLLSTVLYSVLAVFFGIWWLIALAWCLPMTIVYFKKTRQGEAIGAGFKICTLLFVNLIAGILMLCDE